MRNVLVDHARRRNAKKRQHGRRQPLVEDALRYWESNHHDLLALDEALDRLGERDATLLRVVELRFFGGLTLEETGKVLGLSPRQTSKAWAFARTWLRRELEKGLADG
jgi:RNA polymerase sigma factor (TIGR02999 family)